MFPIELHRDRRQGPSLVEQIVQAFEAAMQQQVLRPGMAVPSLRRFARMHGVSTFTVAAAYGRLLAQGRLVSRPGAGYRVASRQDLVPEKPRPARWTPPEVGPAWLLADIFADHSIPIKSGCGWLPAEWMNETGLRQALRQLARMPLSQLGGYGHPYGYHPLRETIAGALAQQGLRVGSAQILLTQGATQALDILIRSLLRPGDVVVVERPGYANLLHALSLAGVTLLAVDRTADGLDLDALGALAARHRIKALFVNTALHNPTGTTLGMGNAFRLLQLAETHNFLVIEDDVSRDLLPGAGPLLAAMAGSERVIYVSGFSKSITPAMRVGYIVAGRVQIAALARSKMASGLTTPEAMERTVHQILNQGDYRRHLRHIQDRLRTAHDVLTDIMVQHGFEIYARPRAGLFLWARAGAGPHSGQIGHGVALARQALRHGIWLAPGEYFFAQRPAPASAASPVLQRAPDQGWFRFNVAYSAHPDLWSFMREHAGR